MGLLASHIPSLSLPLPFPSLAVTGGLTHSPRSRKIELRLISKIEAQIPDEEGTVGSRCWESLAGSEGLARTGVEVEVVCEGVGVGVQAWEDGCEV